MKCFLFVLCRLGQPQQQIVYALNAGIVLHKNSKFVFHAEDKLGYIQRIQIELISGGVGGYDFFRHACNLVYKLADALEIMHDYNPPRGTLDAAKYYN